MKPAVEVVPRSDLAERVRRLVGARVEVESDTAYQERLRRHQRTLVEARGGRWCEACLGRGCATCEPTVDERLERAGVPLLVLVARFERVEPELRALAAGLVRYLEAGCEQSLLLFGPPGLGKTYLAGCICRWSVEHRWSVAWAHVPSMLRELRASYDRQRRADGEVESEDEILRRLRSPRLLVLNDLGAEERIGPWVQSQIETLVDERLEAGRRMVVTTNLGPEQLGEAYGARLASRLGARFFRLVGLDGSSVPDFRQRRG